MLIIYIWYVIVNSINYNITKNMENKKSDFYIVGGGITWLSAAVYLIQDWKIDWKRITIYDKAKRMWWALDWRGYEKKDWYVIRWIRVFEETAYTCTMDLMKRIPAIDNRNKTIKDNYKKFNKKNDVYFESRLIKNKEVVDARKFKLTKIDRLRLVKLLFTSESKIENRKIEDYFSEEFFHSNFRYEFCTVFAFEPWHSLVECKRYILRSIHSCQYFDTLEPLQITPLNQYEFMVLPIMDFLKEEGVNFEVNTRITNLDIIQLKEKKRVRKIFLRKDNEENEQEVIVNPNDWVFISIWSMVSNTTLWSMSEAPIQNITKKSVAWTLWENIAENNPELGNPKIFDSQIDKTSWISYTITFKDPLIRELISKYINKKVTTFWWSTIIDSNWFMSFGFYLKPHFKDQDKDTTIAWWYSLYSDKIWNYVKKRMFDCTWEEILTELMHHLWLENYLEEIIKTTICIPCYSPYVTSHFLAKKHTDRPQVVPETSLNFAFLWQFCEIKDDIVFTVEYSIRSAQMAVYNLLKLKKKLTPIYKWHYSPKVLFNAMKTIFR